MGDNTICAPTGMTASKAAINSALMKVVASTPNCAWVTAQAAHGQPALGNNDSISGIYSVHYCTASQRTLGARYETSFERLMDWDGNSVPVALPAPLFKTGVSGGSIVDTVGGRTVTLAMAGMTATQAKAADCLDATKLLLISSGTGYASVSGDCPAGSYSIHQELLGPVNRHACHVHQHFQRHKEWTWCTWRPQHEALSLGLHAYGQQVHGKAGAHSQVL